MELNKGEIFFITTIREFDFLRKLKYEGSRFSIVGREFFIEFENHKIGLTVTVIVRESQEVDILISRKKFWGIELKNIKEFNICKEYPKTLEKYAQLLKEKFEDILKGEKW